MAGKKASTMGGKGVGQKATGFSATLGKGKQGKSGLAGPFKK